MANTSSIENEVAPANANPPMAFNLDLEKTAAAAREFDSDLDAAATIVNSDRGSTSGRDDDEEKRDPNLVSWDGPNDPENPMNWPDKKKWANIAVLSIMTVVT